MKKTLGQRIRELRDEKDFSLREFADKLGGISAAHISDIELGRRYPSDELLKKMADKLDTTVDDLRSYDSRAPVEDLKRMSESDATFGFALRKLLDKEVTAEEIIKWADKKPDRKK
jgi:transcriptional regulator with XRE-family HTH domain